MIDLDTHREVFQWVLGVLANRGLVKGQRIGVDATTLEANPAMRSILRRDSRASYEEFLVGLANQRCSRTATGELLLDKPFDLVDGALFHVSGFVSIS